MENNQKTRGSIIACIAVIVLTFTAAVVGVCCSHNNISETHTLELSQSGNVLWNDQSLEIRLQENSTTGYKWIFEGYDVANSYYEAPQSNGMTGVPGMRKATFTPKESGYLTCLYVRSWEHNKAPAQSIKLKIIIENEKIIEVTEIPAN